MSVMLYTSSLAKKEMLHSCLNVLFGLAKVKEMCADCSHFSVHFDKLICLILSLPFYPGNVKIMNKWFKYILVWIYCKYFFGIF